MSIHLLANYLNTSIKIEDFNVIEKVYEEKGIMIYKFLEEEKERCLVIERNGVFNKLFLKANVAPEGSVIIDTFKYSHFFDIENSVVSTHNYKKRWVDGMLPFWIILIMCLYYVLEDKYGLEDKKLSKLDKIIFKSWIIITGGITIYFSI